MVAHVFFSNGPNFWLATFAFAVEGYVVKTNELATLNRQVANLIRWIFYSAVNSITPQIILNLGFEDNSWDIAVRQLSYQIPSLTFSLVVTWWATRFKDLSKLSRTLCISQLINFDRNTSGSHFWDLSHHYNLLRQHSSLLVNPTDCFHDPQWHR